MVTMSSFGKFQSGSNTESFQEIRTTHASSLHSEIVTLKTDCSSHTRITHQSLESLNQPLASPS